VIREARAERHQQQKARRAERERELAAATNLAATQLGSKLYGVIYADPAWKYDNTGTGLKGVADDHYPTAELQKICDLEVPAADDCVLFLWATIPMLPEALAVMSAWGFKYKSGCGWIKDRVGNGYWFRGALELLLVGIKGNVPAPAPGDQPPQVVEAPRARHSEKPDCFASMIATLFPNTPRVELFARKARPGWDCWGNEIEPPAASASAEAAP
jgi:N6-adenosine-specific RNA methylase IME4